MIAQVEAMNYRCLRDIRQPLKPFHVLVGPNVSGKTTFLDVIGLLRDIVVDGLDEAAEQHASNPPDLLFQHRGAELQLAIEAKIPDTLKPPEYDTVRYQTSLGPDETAHRFELKSESLLPLRSGVREAIRPRNPFPLPLGPPDSVLVNIKKSNNKALLNKAHGGNDNFYSERRPANGGWVPSFRLGSREACAGQPAGR